VLAVNVEKLTPFLVFCMRFAASSDIFYFRQSRLRNVSVEILFYLLKRSLFTLTIMTDLTD